MRDLVFEELKEVSGAEYGVCTMDDYYTYTGPSIVEVDYNYQSPMLIFSQVLTAALVGCIGGFATGRGIAGCAISGGIAAGAKTMGYFIDDAYWMYQQAKN